MTSSFPLTSSEAVEHRDPDGSPQETFETSRGFGYRVWWPAGLAELSPTERAKALKRGWWHDGDRIIHRDGTITERKR